MKKYSVSFVFPMYNEKDNIEESVRRALNLGREVTDDFEIIIVDDASTDGSGEIADRLAEIHPEVKVIHHEVNRKLGATIRTGFSNATKELIFYTDADLPIDFDEARIAFDIIRQADIVTGYRIGERESLRRKMLSAGYNFYIRLFFGLQVRDVNFAFKLFRRKILDDITLHSEGSFIDAEFLMEAVRKGYHVREIGLHYYPRVAGKSTLSSASVILKTLKESLKYWWRRRFS